MGASDLTKQVVSLLESGALAPRTLVWRRGLPAARPLETLQTFAAITLGRVASGAPAALEPALAPEPKSGSGTARAGTRGRGASTGRAMIGRSEQRSSAYLETHIYGVSGASAVAGRMLAGVRVALGRRVALGAEAAIPWISPEGVGEGGTALFGNLALLADVRLFGSDDLHGTAGLKVHFPTLGALDDRIEREAAGWSYYANSYEPGFYLAHYMTLRPDLRLHCRFGGLVLAAELGLDFLIPTGDEDPEIYATYAESYGSFHTGFKLGYVTRSGGFFAYGELSLVKLFQLSETASYGDYYYNDDPPVHMMTGPGIKVTLGWLELGLALSFPLTDELREALDLTVAFQLGGRW